MVPKPKPKPKLTDEEHLARLADRQTAIRLRMAIWRHLDEHSITMPAGISAAVGMSPAEAAKLLTGGRRWREGDVAMLKAVAARLGVSGE